MEKVKKTKKMNSKKIAAELHELIASQQLKPGTPISSVRELSDRYNVALRTADRALNLLVKNKIIYRKRGSGSFVKRAISSVKPLSIGFLEYAISPQATGWDKMHDMVISQCIAYFRKHDISVKMIAYNSLVSGDVHDELVRDVDVILAAASHIDQESLKRLEAIDKPVVIYRNEEIYPHYSQVMPNWDMGFSALFKEILKRHFKRYTVVYQNHSTGRARRDAFLRYAAMHKIDDIELICTEQGGGYKEGIQISRNGKGSFVFSTSDYVSYQLVEALEDNGIEVGQDIDLVSCDNFEGIQPRRQEPILTAIDYPYKEIAHTAVKLVMQVIQHHDKLQHIIKIPSKLIIRKTAFANNP